MPTPAELAARALAARGVSSPGLMGDIEAFLRTGGVAAVEAGLPIVEESAGVTIEAAGADVAGLALWPVVLILLLILCTLRVLENIIIYPFGLIPFAGGRVQNAIRTGFRWLDNFENMVIAQVLLAIDNLFKQGLQLFSFVLGIVAPDAMAPHATPVPNHTGYATEAEIQRINAEIRAANARINALDLMLQPNVVPSPLPIPGVTTNPLGTPQPTVIRVGVPQTVWDQIHYVEHKIVAHQTSITDLYSRTDRLTNIATQIQTEFRSLTGEIHAVRAVSAGWQDIQQELENLGSLTTQFIDETSAELGKVVSVQTQMLPLTLLLEPGIKGLRNLRKLEDNICQCPKFANIPNELGTALAVLEFVENG